MGKQIFSVKDCNEAQGTATVTAEQAEYVNSSVQQMLTPGTTVVIPAQKVHLQKIRKDRDDTGKFVYANVYDRTGKYMYTTGVSVSAFQRSTYGTEPIEVELIEKVDRKGNKCMRAAINAFDTNIDAKLKTEANENLELIVPETSVYHIDKGQIHYVSSMQQETSGAWSVVADEVNPGLVKLDRRYYPNIVSAALPDQCILDKDKKVLMPETLSAYML